MNIDYKTFAIVLAGIILWFPAINDWWVILPILMFFAQ